MILILVRSLFKNTYRGGEWCQVERDATCAWNDWNILKESNEENNSFRSQELNILTFFIKLWLCEFNNVWRHYTSWSCNIFILLFYPKLFFFFFNFVPNTSEYSPAFCKQLNIAKRVRVNSNMLLGRSWYWKLFFLLLEELLKFKHWNLRKNK